MENTRQGIEREVSQSVFLTAAYRLPHDVDLLAPEDDHISKWYKQGAYYEGAMLEHIRRTYPSGMNIIDVGAHVGGHSLFFAKACAAHSVCAFEPQPPLFDLLEKNVARNDMWDRVHPFNYAVGATMGYAKPIGWPAGNTGMAKVQPCSKLYDPEGLVRMVTLDSCMQRETLADLAPDLIKIDVEGMGLDVLRGARHLIRTYLPAIFIECQEERDRLAVYTELAPLGYRQHNRFNHTPTYEFAVR